MLTASRPALSMEPHDYFDSSSYGLPINQDTALEYGMSQLTLQGGKAAGEKYSINWLN